MKLNFALILVLFFTVLNGCVSQNEEESKLENDKIEGFSIPLPEDWIDRSDLNIKDNLSKFEMEEEQLSKMIKSHNGSIPIAIYVKYDPSTHGGVIPTIQVNLRPNGTKSMKSFKAEMEKSIIAMSNYMSKFKIIQELEEVVVDGVKGLRFISQFDMMGTTGEDMTIRSWSYAIPVGNYFYQINFSDTETDNCAILYNQLISEVKFRK